ncbi:hypothetical protein BH09SUM1_BH09SUM1_20720 [soil metagenome]
MNQRLYVLLTAAFLCVGSLCFGQQTTESLRLVGDLNKVTVSAYGSSSNPNNLVVMGVTPQSEGKLYFTADDGIHGQEVWEWDGTASGFRMLGEVVPGPGSIANAIAGNGTFSLHTESNTLLVDRTDGAPQIYHFDTNEFLPASAAPMIGARVYDLVDRKVITGTQRPVSPDTVYHGFFGVLDAQSYAATGISQPVSISNVGRPFFNQVGSNALLYFERGENELRLMKTDGTTTGSLLMSFPGGHRADLVGRPSGKFLYAVGVVGSENDTVVLTDGSPQNTRIVAQNLLIRPVLGNTPDLAAGPLILPVLQNNSMSLMLSNDDLSATSTLITFSPGPSKFTVFTRYLNTVALIFLFDGQHYQAYRTDYTAAGTFPVHQFLMSDGALPQPVEWEGRIYFQDSGDNGVWQIWETDGSVDGTRKLLDTLPQETPSNLCVYRRMLVFGGRFDEGRGDELYVLRGRFFEEDYVSNAVQVLGGLSQASDWNMDGAIDSADSLFFGPEGPRIP